MLRLDGVNMANATQNTNENVVQLASDHVTTLIFSISSLLFNSKPHPLVTVLRPRVGTALGTVFTRGLWLGIVTAPVVPTVGAMPAMAEHMHRHKRDEEQNPNPIL